MYLVKWTIIQTRSYIREVAAVHLVGDYQVDVLRIGHHEEVGKGLVVYTVLNRSRTIHMADFSRYHIGVGQRAGNLKKGAAV